jgi:hypothetical protein
MSSELDIFKQIENALFDLQSAQHRTFERPLRTLSRLLHHVDLEPFNKRLIEGVDFDGFLSASEATESMGSGSLALPDDHEQALGLTLLLIDKMGAEPDFAVQVAFRFFGAGTQIAAAIHSMNRQLLIPFVRDYKTYVRNHGNVEPRLVRPSSNKVFIVHGHDGEALNSVARFIEKLGLEAIILKELPNQGRTIIEKFEESAKDVGFALVLMTPDDVGGAKVGDQVSRARQNVIFELGFFTGKLGRGHVCLLRKGDVEIPSDLFGVVYTDLDPGEGWKHRLVAELKAAKLEFDANRMWG